MNNTNIPTKILKEILPLIIFSEFGITVNTCGFDTEICEFTFDGSGEIEIAETTEEKDIVDIKWHLHFNESYEEANDAWTFKYQTLVDRNIIDYYIAQT